MEHNTQVVLSCSPSRPYGTPVSVKVLPRWPTAGRPRVRYVGTPPNRWPVLTAVLLGLDFFLVVNAVVLLVRL